MTTFSGTGEMERLISTLLLRAAFLEEAKLYSMSVLIQLSADNITSETMDLERLFDKQPLSKRPIMADRNAGKSSEIGWLSGWPMMVLFWSIAARPAHYPAPQAATFQ